MQKILYWVHKTLSMNWRYCNTMDEVYEHLGCEREERDETADELQRAITRAMVEYDQYQKKKELQALIDILDL